MNLLFTASPKRSNKTNSICNPTHDDYFDYDYNNTYNPDSDPFLEDSDVPPVEDSSSINSSTRSIYKEYNNGGMDYVNESSKKGFRKRLFPKRLRNNNSITITNNNNNKKKNNDDSPQKTEEGDISFSDDEDNENNHNEIDQNNNIQVRLLLDSKDNNYDLPYMNENNDTALGITGDNILQSQANEEIFYDNPKKNDTSKINTTTTSNVVKTATLLSNNDSNTVYDDDDEGDIFLPLTTENFVDHPSEKKHLFQDVDDDLNLNTDVDLDTNEKLYHIDDYFDDDNIIPKSIIQSQQSNSSYTQQSNEFHDNPTSTTPFLSKEIITKMNINASRDMDGYSTFNNHYNYPQTSLYKTIQEEPNFQPISQWIGRLLFNPYNKRKPNCDNSVYIEIEHAPLQYKNLIGETLPLRYDTNQKHIQEYMKLTTRNVELSKDGRKKINRNEFLKAPIRLHYLMGVGPLESLAGSRLEDDVHVILPDGGVSVGKMVKVDVSSTSSDRELLDEQEMDTDEDERSSDSLDYADGGSDTEFKPLHLKKRTNLKEKKDDGEDNNNDDDEGRESNDPSKPTIYLQDHPIQVTGVYYCVVTILERKNRDILKVRHFNATTGQFDGPTQEIRYPHAQKLLFSSKHSVYPSTNINIENSPENKYGWYFYGNFVTINAEDTFVVEAVEPVRALSLNPDQLITKSGLASSSYKNAFKFINHQNYSGLKHRIGSVSTTLIDLTAGRDDSATINMWKEGDRMILIHTTGGCKSDTYNKDSKIGGYVAGHFAYGYATVVRDKLTHQLRFDIDYIQVYRTNALGVVAGAVKRQCFVGSLHIGCLGMKPVSDCLVKLDIISNDYKVGDGIIYSPWNEFKTQLHIMTARYRVGDGDGISRKTNSTQDSNQSLYVAIDKIEDTIVRNLKKLKRRKESEWDFDEVLDAEKAEHLEKLKNLGSQLHSKIAPLGTIRQDWEKNALNISCKKRSNFLFSTSVFARNKRPRSSFDAMLKVFLRNDAKLWFITTVNVGGNNENVVPLKPKKILQLMHL